MKKIALVLVALLACLCVSCAERPQETIYTVTFDSNGHNVQMPQSVQVGQGQLVQKPADPYLLGWDFEGWYADKDATEVWYFDTDVVREDLVLYAHFVRGVHEVAGKSLITRHVRLLGRHEFVNEHSYFYYTASGFEVGFEGTSLKVCLYSQYTAALSYAIDGDVLTEGEVLYLQQGTHEYELGKNLQAGAHTITVLKRSEPQDGATALVSLDTDGRFLPKEQRSALKFLCIGGSGISGHGSLGKPSEGRTVQNSSSLHSFGYLTARVFDADVQFVSASGWGVKFGYNQNSATRGSENLLTALDYVGIDSNNKIIKNSYDMQQFVPDVVIVNAGGNDYNSTINGLSGNKQSEAITEFKQACSAMVTRLVELNSKVVIFWTYTSGAKNGLAAVAAFNALPSNVRNRIVPVVIAGVASNGDPAGANAHASVYTHIRNSQSLVEAILLTTDYKAVKEQLEP